MAMTLTEVAYEELLNMFSTIQVPPIQSKKFICYLNALSFKTKEINVVGVWLYIISLAAILLSIFP